MPRICMDQSLFVAIRRIRQSTRLPSCASSAARPTSIDLSPAGLTAVSAATEGRRLHAVVRQSRFHLYRPLALRCGLGRDRVDVHRRGAAAQSLRAEVVEREASEIRKPLHCVARDEELALEVSRRLFDA